MADLKFLCFRIRSGALHRVSELIYYLGTRFYERTGKQYGCKKLIRFLLGRRAAPGNIVFIHVVNIIRVHTYKTYLIIIIIIITIIYCNWVVTRWQWLFYM